MVLVTSALAHPGSGIVVDREGQVYFQDIVGRTIWKIDARGRITKFSDKYGGHWMALNDEGSLARSDVSPVERITPPGVKPALIVADGGAPIAVCRDGNLYYGLRLLDGDRVAVGLTRITPDGKRSPFAADSTKAIENLGITGLAPSPDGSLYVACPSVVIKVSMDGKAATIARPVVVRDCDEDLADNNPSPYLRGIAVDSRGVVYAAACGCHRVVKIAPDGKIETILKSERPWSPTGVAVHGDDVFVLEYTNANGGPNEGWQPRVRKVGRDGIVTVLATIEKSERDRRPR
jgi:sugar lactone lactonase YvrE